MHNTPLNDFIETFSFDYNIPENNYYLSSVTTCDRFGNPMETFNYAPPTVGVHNEHVLYIFYVGAFVLSELTGRNFGTEKIN